MPIGVLRAVGREHLAGVGSALIKAGVRRVPLEKPGALTYPDIIDLARSAREHGSSVAIGYNRRFYASTREVREAITDDGGVLS